MSRHSRAGVLPYDTILSQVPELQALDFYPMFQIKNVLLVYLLVGDISYLKNHHKNSTIALLLLTIPSVRKLYSYFKGG